MLSLLAASCNSKSTLAGFSTSERSGVVCRGPRAYNTGYRLHKKGPVFEKRVFVNVFNFELSYDNSRQLSAHDMILTSQRKSKTTRDHRWKHTAEHSYWGKRVYISIMHAIHNNRTFCCYGGHKSSCAHNGIAQQEGSKCL